jgi:hypothetical protein
MNLLRYGHDTNGATVLNGASWDLLAVAFWVGIAVIVGHLIWRKVRRGSGGASGG